MIMAQGIVRSTSAGPGLTGRRVLMLALGFFGLVLLANLAFVWLSLSTFSGSTEQRAYLEGLRYNELLAAAAEQKARGWQGGVTLEANRLTLVLSDATGRPVTGLVLRAQVGRPATRLFDRELVLEEIAPGRYAAEAALAPGSWSVAIAGTDRDGRPFRTETRLWR